MCHAGLLRLCSFNTGALHDNGRAIIMGDSSTYGKGRIQSVFELQDGSALFVTVAKYQTPNGETPKAASSLL
jgi:C-terminal processing protease CtpA/Prc